jgi:hypothetical protein
MRLRTGIVVPATFAALLALASDGLCQGVPPGGPPAGAGKKAEPAQPSEPAAAPAPAPAPKEQVDTQVDVKGSRFRVTLNHGPRIEGILPQGVYWEKLDTMTGEYEESQESDAGAGLRMYYVLGMEGDLFIRKSTIKEIKDLGALTEEQKRAIRDQVIADRKQKITDREKALKEEMSKMKVRERDEARKADAAKKEEGKADEKSSAAAAEEEKKGDALLEKYPYPDWSEERRTDILKRRYTIGRFPDEEEKVFIDEANFKLWKAALERKQKAEEKKKEASKEEKK